MPILSPRSKSNPKFGTDVSKSKFKLAINGVPRQRRSASADDDAPKSRDWKSKYAPKMNNFSAKDSNRDTFKAKFQSRKQPSETKSSGDFNFKTEKKQLRTKTEGRKRFNEESAEAAIGDSKSTSKRTSALNKGLNREAFKAKFQSRKQSSEMKSSGELNFKTEKKQFRMKTEGKKSYNEESAEPALGDRPKRGRKRIGIRLDPYDISNKRLDDSIALNETNEEKKMKTKEDSEKVELSKNAQFRAIMPSPSILTFVQENLLGRRRSIELQRAGYNIDLSAPLDNIPFSTSSERERVEESIFRNKLEFFAAAKISSSFPPVDAPEIAFAGRSNVGKSSLLNSLTRQWGVVRTSDKPGLTQTINFFNLGPKLSLVDLPGYGFAYAKEEVKDSWEELVKEYVSTRVGLKRVCLLVDTKWGMKPRDHELVNLMERSQTKYQIVLTKTDIVFPMDVARRAMQIEEALKENKSVIQPLMMISSKSGAGIRSLRTVLAKVARFVKP